MPSALADAPTPQAGRPLRWAAGLSLFVALVVAGAAVLLLREDRYVAPPTPHAATPVRAPDAAGAADAVEALEDAVVNEDAAAAATLADPADGAVEQVLRAVVRNAAALGVRDFSLRYVAEDGPVRSDGSWSAAVEAAWRFGGFDASAAVAEVRFGFRGTEDGVRLTGIGGGDGRSPTWLTGPVRVERGGGVLVLGAEGVPVARYARLARAAVPVVRAVLPGWRSRLVVEVPADAEALDRALGVDPGTYRNIAAVTTSVDGSTGPDAPVHILVNAAEFGRLRDLGAQVVMSHEVAHVATAAATSDMPLWLLEGFADYVALRDVDLPAATTARQAIARVRREGVPASLPTDGDFDVAGPHLGAVYETAWLACVVLAERAGERGLVRVFEAVRDGRSVDAALRAEAWSERALVRAWRERLRELAA